MSDPTKPATPTKLEPPKRPETYAVRMLRFREPHDFGNGKDGANNLTATQAGAAAPRGRWEITYLPFLRHFLVVGYPSVGAPLTKYVHESAVIDWEPVAL